MSFIRRSTINPKLSISLSVDQFRSTPWSVAWAEKETSSTASVWSTISNRRVLRGSRVIWLYLSVYANFCGEITLLFQHDHFLYLPYYSGGNIINQILLLLNVRTYSAAIAQFEILILKDFLKDWHTLFIAP